MNKLSRLKRTPIKTYQDLILYLYNDAAPGTETIRCRQITFQVTEDCCMACTYCYQNHKTQKKMTWETIKPFLDELLTDQHPFINTTTTFGLILDFIGGEPLLEIELIDQICTYIFNYMIIYHHPWLLKTCISISSNGLLYFEPKVQSFLKKFGEFCDLGFSLDGDKTLHDSCRKDKLGNGTYDRTLKAALTYAETYHRSLNTKMTLSPANVIYSGNAIIDLIQKGFQDIWVNCVYEEGWTYEHGTILYYQFKQIADYIISNDLQDKIFIRIFDNELYQPIPDSETQNWCGGVAETNIAIDPDGKYYSCIRYMESSLNGHQRPLSYGSIQTGFLTTEQEQADYKYMTNITRQEQSTEECLNCPIAKGCGWCSAYNYERFGDIRHRATFICPMHKAASLINVYYWNKLYLKFNLSDIFPLLLDEKEINKLLPTTEKELLYQLTRR